MPGLVTPPDRAVIQLENLTRIFGRTTALAGLNMAVPEGAVYGFVGNNGAGKTTAIHTLLGLIPATNGSGQVLGLDISKHSHAIRRRVGFFAERDEPYDWIRVGMLLRVAQHTFPDWDPDLAEKLRARFDLDPRKRVKQLSKGMTAKAKLIVALAHRPALLVLDEPTSGLDPSSRLDLLDTIREQTRDQGVTALFSSHNLDEVERIATYLGVIHRGRMVYEAPIDHITDRFGLLENSEIPEALHAWILATGPLGDKPTMLLRDRQAPAVRAYIENHPDASLRPATVPEAFRLLTHDTASPAGRSPSLTH